jgi:signal transduction histidine kinase
MSLPRGFAERYAAGLAGQLSQAAEATLHEAYQLGRQALNEGVRVLDIALLHHHALTTQMVDNAIEDESEWLGRAADFLAECLSPFEMTLQGYRDANVRLLAMNDTLEKANEKIRSAHEKLTAEVAERRRVEEALWQAQKLQAVGRLAGGIAHHFNNLLTVALGHLEVARSAAGAGPLERAVGVSFRALERGAKLTRQLLSFSRQQMLKPETIELAQRLPEIATLLRGTVRADIALETDFVHGLWATTVDPAELEFAILNLAINARDAMPNGGHLHVSAANRRIRDGRLGLDGDYVEIAIVDDGAGIPAEILPRVFDPFFTTKERQGQRSRPKPSAWVCEPVWGRCRDRECGRKGNDCTTISSCHESGSGARGLPRPWTGGARGDGHNSGG